MFGGYLLAIEEKKKTKKKQQCKAFKISFYRTVQPERCYYS